MMMAKIGDYEKQLDRLVKELKFQGFWQIPDVDVPKIKMNPQWKEETARWAEVMNRIFRIRSLSKMTRMFGPVEDTEPDEFVQECYSLEEKKEFVEQQFHLMIKNLEIFPELDVSEYELEDY